MMQLITFCCNFSIRSNFLAGFVLILVLGFAESLSAQSNWKEEWEKILRAAEIEGQLTLYGCCYEYDRILEGFKKKHPKIKVTTVLGTGNQLSSRILAERRGDKYLPDVFSAGANTVHDVLYKARALDPFRPALILPEVLDLSKWHDGEHRYIDPEKKYIFAFVANSQSGQVSYTFNRSRPASSSPTWISLIQSGKEKWSLWIRQVSAWARRCSSFISIPS
jgi:ABC-type glycerol-3-phosphate transport system substrate-binding protein